METLKGNIDDLIDILNNLRNNTDDPSQQDRIQKVLRILFKLFEADIHQQLDTNAADYMAALQSLSQAQKAVTDAITDVSKVAGAIEFAVDAAKKVDQVIKVIGPILL